MQDTSSWAICRNVPWLMPLDWEQSRPRQQAVMCKTHWVEGGREGRSGAYRPCSRIFGDVAA